MRPPPIAAFIPPVTGYGGYASSVSANMFDTSGYFRPRSGSGFKRKRGYNGSAEAPFDLTKDFPSLQFPPPLNLDMAGIKVLMVEAATKVAATETLMGDGRVSDANKAIAATTIALFKLVEGVVEKAIMPLANGPRAQACVGAADPAAEPAGIAELRAALVTAEKTAIVFGADLGDRPIANRNTLAANFTGNLRALAISKAGEDGEQAAEAVRVTADAMSCATNMEFLGQSSKESISVTTGEGVGRTFCTMPVKLEFEDRSGRLHFERTMRQTCGVRSSISLPPGIRAEQKKFHDQMKEKYPEHIIMIRPDTKNLCFGALIKKDGERDWNWTTDTLSIDPACLSVTFTRTTNRPPPATSRPPPATNRPPPTTNQNATSDITMDP